ncbi:hypothetical protein V6X73_09345 [Spiribacter sp. 390]|uniref:Uncharacterized protein n=1 Tax=Spiribacter pallidus TaxID=1987936 RepID=A0ABV3TFA7_9GAMM
MKDDIFNEDDLLVITIRDDESGTFVEKRLPDGQTWTEVLIQVVHMLNGVGYYIDSVKAAEQINNMFEEAKMGNTYE